MLVRPWEGNGLPYRGGHGRNRGISHQDDSTGNLDLSAKRPICRWSGS
jgi:hypothetical protein